MSSRHLRCNLCLFTFSGVTNIILITLDQTHLTPITWLINERLAVVISNFIVSNLFRSTVPDDEFDAEPDDYHNFKLEQEVLDQVLVLVVLDGGDDAQRQAEENHQESGNKSDVSSTLPWTPQRSGSVSRAYLKGATLTTTWV